ncbi:PQQ-binding-like beta-propeller repeat protein [Streptomyces sp. NPDC088337]|uniref:outer membrane protein assembly factor BamB family protein n=1 Tax=unclassified Streptomyces TaxID=2593676 RepID=UPI00382A97B4
MTQPPPPPNQPPQHGGYGQPQGRPQQPAPHAPPVPPAQTPPAGGPDLAKSPQPAPGYGYPQAPPPHGAPQAPPPAGPPQPPSGYGYPGGQPNPYAQPPAGQPNPYGAQQPGYGYPAQPPTVPLQPQTGQPGGGRKVNAQVAMIVSTVVVIALIIGTGIWYSHRSDGGKQDTANSGGAAGKDGKDDGTGGAAAAGKEKVPSDTAARVLFQVPAPAVKDTQVDSVEGSWLTDTVYAKSGVNQIVGYDPDTGTSKWTLPLTGETCSGSKEITADGVAVVLSEEAKRNSHGNHEPCTQITAFKVDTGQKLWTKSIATNGRKVPFGEVSISGTTIAVGGGYEGGAALDARTGKVLWQPKTESCQDVGYAGGERLVAVRKCGSFGNERYEVQLLDPTTGAVKWSYKLPVGIDNAKVISTEPVVFGVDSGGVSASGATDIFSLDDQGKLRYKITLASGDYGHRCDIGRFDGCKKIVVGNGKLYVPTADHEGTGAGSRTNEIIAYSLETGRTTGDRIDAGDGYTIFPIRMDGGNILVYKDGPYDKGSQVLSVDGATTKQTKLLETPADRSVRDAISGMVPGSAELLYTHGRLFMGKNLTSKPYSADEQSYTAIGFGANVA